jgi:hypothetical protein
MPPHITWKKQLLPQANPTELLPLAVAVLLPEKAELPDRLIKSVAFAQSFWVGRVVGKITDFSSARNSVTEYVSEPWLFWLDSDEWLDSSAETIAQLHQATSQTAVAGFLVNRQDYFLAKPLCFGEPARVSLLRLAQTTKAKFIRPVHETWLVDGVVQTLPVAIHHQGHDSISSFLTKVIAYASIEAEYRLASQPLPSLKVLQLQTLVWPIGKFLHNFFWLQGWRDGWRGLIYALLMSIHSATVRICLWEKSLIKVTHENK